MQEKLKKIKKYLKAQLKKEDQGKNLLILKYQIVITKKK